jgi:hypothetical protein
MRRDELAFDPREAIGMMIFRVELDMRTRLQDRGLS